METAHKYEELEKFISENFSTTTNMNDRLHTRDILDIFNRNKFLFSDSRMAEIFKTMNLGEHRRSCTINRAVKSGYYYLKYNGENLKGA